MLDSFTIGRNYAGDSTIHRLAAGTKLLLALGLALAVVSRESFASFFLLGVFLIGLLVLARLPSSFYARNLRFFGIVALLIATCTAFMYPGQVWVSLGPLFISYEGMWRGIRTGYRLIFLFLDFSLLTLTTSPLAISRAMAGFLAPLRRIGFPTQELAVISAISLAYIPLIFEDANKIVDAQTARGGDFHSYHLARRMQTLFSVLTALIAVSLQRAEEVACAMEIRCYKGEEGRTHYRDERVKRADYALLTILAMVLIAATLI